MGPPGPPKGNPRTWQHGGLPESNLFSQDIQRVTNFNLLANSRRGRLKCEA